MRVILILKKYFFHDLCISIPVNESLWADLLEYDSFDSFSEIFVKQEYLNYLPSEIPLSVIDVGANYGFFSLWLQSKYPNKKINSLLIEASPSCAYSIEKLIKKKSLGTRFKLLKGAIGPTNMKSVNFFERSFMASSTIPLGEEGTEKNVLVPCLSEEEILGFVNSQVDLIKCDIEGSEWELLNNYPNLLSCTKYLLLEWHSWHSGSGSYDQIIETLHSLNFTVEKMSPTQKASGRDGEVGLLLASNLLN